MPSAHEYFSQQFQKWEERGRGWQVFDQPVQPEPPFVPFLRRAMTDNPVVDDGCRPSFLGSLFRGLAPKPAPVVEPEPEEEPEPTPLVRDSLVELQVALPADLDIARDSFEQLFRSLALSREPVVFELLGTHRRVLAQFAASVEDAPTVQRQLTAHFPDVQFRQQTGTLEQAWDTGSGDEACAVEFGLEREFMFPLATGNLDPFIGIVGALAGMQPGELALFQVIFQAAHEDWPESIMRSVTHADGKPFFVNEPDLVPAADSKIARPLYAAVVRILVRTRTTNRLHEIARELAGSLRVFINPQGNALIPLKNDDYPLEDHINDVLCRQSRRSGMILNSDELIGFVHLPSTAVRSPALARDSGRTKAAPDIVQHRPGILIGDNEHNGDTVEVYLTPEQRVRHTHIIGSNGTGKSSLLLNMIRQDIENHDGVAVLDPHGDLIDQILGCIPENRINDVVLVDLADEEFPVGFNLLEANTETEKRLLASDLVGVFRRLSRTWGDQMDTVLQNAILAILKSSRGGTLVDLREFLENPKFRNEFLPTVRSVEVMRFWTKVFPGLSRDKSVNSLLARLQDFFSSEPICNMVSQRGSSLNFSEIMDSGKIFLAKLSTGLGGDENSYLLGTLLVSKFQQMAMARQEQKVEDRKNFWLYIDEFQHFISPSMEKILTGTRKYKFGFTLAHQNLHQLRADADVAAAVMTQPCTRIVLGVGDDDAKRLGECFDSFDGKSLTRLEKYHALVRVERNDFDFNLALRKPEQPGGGEERKAAVIAASRRQYARPRAEVEATLLAEILPDAKPPESPSTNEPPGGRRKPTPNSPPVAPPEAVMPAPPLAKLQSSAPPQSAEPPKAAEVPKPAVPPTLPGQTPPVAEIAQVTVSEKENRELPPVKLAGTSPEQSEDGVAVESKSEHEALKDEIQAHAESLDFTVTRETPIPEHGRPDLILTRGKHSIACEISVKTHKTSEADHIRLRLKAGFTHVAVISQNRRKLPKIEASYLKMIPGASLDKVGFYSRDEFLSQLSAWALDDPEGGAQERAKPRKQNLGSTPPPKDPIERAAVQRALLDDLRKQMARDRQK